MKLPYQFAMNAYDPSSAKAAISDVPRDADIWALKNKPDLLTFLASEDFPDLRNWNHPKVGWGLIVAENPSLSPDESANLVDYEHDPILKLWKARGRGSVFRWDPSRTDRLVVIRNATSREDVLLTAAPVGTGPGCLPRYLLIYGDPEEISWDLQYILNQNRNCFPGRIPFKGAAAGRYIDATCSNFQGASAKRSSAAVWSAVCNQQTDGGMTALMSRVIALPLTEKLKADAELTDAIFMDAGDATVDRLLSELEQRNPALIVTTSHGVTGPLNNPVAMAASLGIPLDSNLVPLSLSALLSSKWKPGGAVWYSHACCSAGSEKYTNFGNLLIPGTTAQQIVAAVAALGSTVAPLPMALLQAESPVRAFIGHVEPTLDFSLIQPDSGAPITSSLISSLYDHLYQRKPETIGMAFRDSFDRIGEMFGLFQASYREYNKGNDVENTPVMIWSLLAANDLKTTVILGDPAVSLPAPP